MDRPVTTESLIALYSKDIAFVTDESPADSADVFADQLRTAAERLGYNAGIHGAEDLETAATYLTDAQHSQEPTEQRVLLDRVAAYLQNVDDMVDEYRLMS
jgi:hypothetical protein